MHPILETIDLVKYYGDGESRIKAIDHTSITVDHGEFVAGAGPVQGNLPSSTCWAAWTGRTAGRSLSADRIYFP